MRNAILIRAGLGLAILAGIGGAAIAVNNTQLALVRSEALAIVAPIPPSRVTQVEPIAGRPDCFTVHYRNWDDARSRHVRQRREVCS